MMIVLLVAMVLAFLRSPLQISGAQHFGVAEFSRDRVAPVWIPVSLPDDWGRSRPGRGGDGWYRLQFSLAQLPTGLWGIYLPRLSMNAEVYVNGVLVGSGGSMVAPVTRYWNLPLYFQVPSALWRTGANELLVHLRAFANGRAVLGSLYVGPDPLLLPVYRMRRLRSYLLSMGAFAVNLALGLILLVWWGLSRDRAFFYFAAGSLLSCIYILDSFWGSVPLLRVDWRWLIHVAVAWSMGFYYLFMLRMLMHPLGRFERLLLAYVGVGALLLGFADDAHQLQMALLLHLGGLAIMLHLIWLTFSGWLRRGRRLHLALGVCMSSVAAFGFTDWIPVAFHLQRDTPYVYYLGPVAFSFAVSLVLLARFLHALEAERHFGRALQDALHEQAQQLQQQHQHITALQREQTLSAERERIMRELHDGMGGHLMGALTLSESRDGVINQRIQAALDELRLIMDSLDPQVDAFTMLAMLRHRLEPGLVRQGIHLDWQVWAQPAGLPPEPVAVLHVMRIAQEAIANSLRHASAHCISVHMDTHGFSIADDGSGFDPAATTRGRGLTNMQWRAARIGANLEIDGHPPRGTRIALRWPRLDQSDS